MQLCAKAIALPAISTLLMAGLFTIPASFAGSDYMSTQPTPRFSVSSFHDTRYYEVTGQTQEDIWAQLHGDANPLAIERDAGTKPLGHASFQYHYDYQSTYGANLANCRVDSGKLEFRFETVLPQLAQQENQDANVHDRWQPFQQFIAEHEAGHHAIYRQLAAELPRVLSDIGEVPCHELAERIRVAVADAVSATRQASAEYDQNHGGNPYLASSF